MGFAYTAQVSATDYGTTDVTTGGVSVAVGDLIVVRLSCNHATESPTGVEDSAGICHPPAHDGKMRCSRCCRCGELHRVRC